jgi:hypothetical protein
MLWLGIAGGLESGAYRKYSMSPKQYLESLVRGAENLRFAGRDGRGKPVFVEAPKGLSRSDARVIPLSGPLTGLGIAGCMLFCTTAGQVVPMMGVSITLLTVTLNIGGGLLSKGVLRVSDDSGDSDNYDNYDDYDEYLDDLQDQVSKQADRRTSGSTIGRNQKENDFTDSVGQDLGLTPEEAERLHRIISKQHLSNEEIRQEAERIIKDRRSGGSK